MTDPDPILPPNEPDPLCRCCRSELRLDDLGFCAACAGRRVPVSLQRHGVVWDWCMVVFADRARPFLLHAWVPDRATAELRFACLDLPALEAEGVHRWRTDEAYRHEVIESVAELVLERGKAAAVRKEGRRHAVR